MEEIEIEYPDDSLHISDLGMRMAGAILIPRSLIMSRFYEIFNCTRSQIKAVDVLIVIDYRKDLRRGLL